MIGLALLPEDKIEVAFEKIKADISEPMRRRFKYYFKYYERFWIKRVKPIRIFVYHKLKRTNNLIEKYHHTMNHKFIINHDPWMFISKMFCIFSVNK